jgi:hypothetical protein
MKLGRHCRLRWHARLCIAPLTQLRNQSIDFIGKESDRPLAQWNGPHPLHLTIGARHKRVPTFINVICVEVCGTDTELGCGQFRPRDSRHENGSDNNRRAAVLLRAF